MRINVKTEKILELEAANDRIQRELADLKQSEIVKDEELNKFREGQTHQLLNLNNKSINFLQLMLLKAKIE